MATSEDTSVPEETDEAATNLKDKAGSRQTAGEEAESGAGYGNHAASWPPVNDTRE